MAHFHTLYEFHSSLNVYNILQILGLGFFLQIFMSSPVSQFSHFRDLFVWSVIVLLCQDVIGLGHIKVPPAPVPAQGATNGDVMAGSS